MTAAVPVVVLEGVSKRYFRKTTLRTLAASLRGRDALGSFWAIRGVDLSVRRGESLGVVGPNGAGKTTLLRVLSGVATQTEGKRLVAGRILALSEMQACLHRDLTGRENIPLLAALVGLSRRDVTARLDSILGFSGLPPDFLDVPVKNYSAGMATRLAVSVAVTGEAELIVVDEGFAGADALFRRRCFDRLRELASGGCAVILVSHEVSEIRAHAHRCVYLREGRVVADGPPETVVDRYEADQALTLSSVPT